MPTKGFDPNELYQKIKQYTWHYDEDIHCPMVLKIMCDKNKGTVSAFCIQANIDDSTFFRWVNAYELFAKCYYIGKMYARENWEKEGRKLKSKSHPIGQITYEFEHWKLIGWSRFGVSNKSTRIRLELDPKNNPSQHYSQLIKQACSGDFTAGEFKQLMEAINVGLNVEQIFAMQKQIDELKADLITMATNTNVANSFTNKSTAETD